MYCVRYVLHAYGYSSAGELVVLGPENLAVINESTY